MNDHSRRNRMSSLAGQWALPLVLLLAALLRFYNLPGQSLWADEGNSAALAHRSLAEIARRTAYDIHPPFYYWLLKGWTAVFGHSETALRSLSATLGVGLAYLTALWGRRFFNRRVGLMAAFIAALSPLQVYYAQETRMYMLLAVLSALTGLVALHLFSRYLEPGPFFSPASLVYVLTVTAGLYTHYAYPLILLAINLTALYLFWGRSHRAQGRSTGPAIRHWLALQAIPLLLYLPWLPTAWRQISTWPAERQAISLLDALGTISTTLFFGLSWPYNLELAAVACLGFTLLLTAWPGPTRTTSTTAPSLPHSPDSTRNTQYATRNAQHATRFTLQSAASLWDASRFTPLLLLWLWFFLPTILTAVIFTPAFLKFLLTAAPALALLLALAAARLAEIVAGRNRLTWPAYAAGGGLLILLTWSSALSLYHYYTDARYARDDYRGITAFIKAVGGPEDAVILNAEGQQEVFRYYYGEPGPDRPAVYPLPRQRPLDPAATTAELQQIAGQAENIYAVYWAARQADPTGLIERWLDTHLFKATDRWYGNVRLVSYAGQGSLGEMEFTPVDYRLGQNVRLTGYTVGSTEISPGDILKIALRWEIEGEAEDLTVFVQVLDQANHLVGQRDAPLVPAEGKPIVDTHGVLIEPGTPPGEHRIIAGLYQSQTGRRLPVTSPAAAGSAAETLPAEFIELGQVEIIRPAAPLPPSAFDMQVRLNEPLGEVLLLGYDLYKPGHRSAPDTPLHPGDPVHLTAYWLAQQPARALEDQLLIQVVAADDEPTPMSVTRPLSGVDYPIEAWQVGEIVRAQYDLFLGNLTPGAYRLALTLNSNAGAKMQKTALTRPFQVVD